MSNLELDPLSKRFSVTNKPVKPALYTPRQDVKRPLDYNDHWKRTIFGKATLNLI